MDTLIDAWLKYHKSRCNSPEVYAKHLVIQQLGHCMGRNAIHKIQPKAVRHRIYLIILGKSGQSLKSTAQGLMEDVTTNEAKGPKSFSPQGLLRSLGEKQECISFGGEFSTILRSIKLGGNMADFKEISNDIFDCPQEYEKRLTDKGNSYNLKCPYWSFVSTCTEEEYYNNLDSAMVQGGWLPRYLHVYSEPNPHRDRSLLPDGIDGKEEYFFKVFLGIRAFFRSSKPFSFVFDEEALEYYNRLDETLKEDTRYDNVRPFVARILEYVIVYSDILYLNNLITVDTIESVESVANANYSTDINSTLATMRTLATEATVGLKYVEQAWVLLEPCLEYCRKISKYVDEDLYVAKGMKYLDNLSDNKFPLERRKFLRDVHMTSTQASLVLKTLEERELYRATEKALDPVHRPGKKCKLIERLKDGSF